MASKHLPRDADIYNLDRIDREAFKVIDEIRCESADGRQPPHPNNDLASTRGYDDANMDNRVDAIERAVMTMARRIDLLLDTSRDQRRDAMTPAP